MAIQRERPTSATTLRNAFRHTHPKWIEVEIRYGFEHFGCGTMESALIVNALEASARRRDWGLPGVPERAELVGAPLDFWNEAGAGTEVQIAAPRKARLREIT